MSMITAKGSFFFFFPRRSPFSFQPTGEKHTVAEEFRNHPGLYTFCTQTLLQHKTKLLHSMSRILLSPVSQVSQCSSGRQYKSPVSKYFCKQSRKRFCFDCVFVSSLHRHQPVIYTSVAMTHSLLSSAITNTDWYTESLGEHIVDILHSGFSLYILLNGIFSSKHFSYL